MEGALRGEPQLFDREIRTPSGEVRYTQASYIPDVGEGEVRGLLRPRHRHHRAAADRRGGRAKAGPGWRRRSGWRGSAAGSGTFPISRMTCSDGLFEIYGISAEEFDGTYQSGGLEIRPPR